MYAMQGFSEVVHIYPIFLNHNFISNSPYNLALSSIPCNTCSCNILFRLFHLLSPTSFVTVFHHFWLFYYLFSSLFVLPSILFFYILYALWPYHYSFPGGTLRNVPLWSTENVFLKQIKLAGIW